MAEVDKYPEQLQAAANILKVDMMMNIIRILQGVPLATLEEQKAEVAKYVEEFTIPNMAFLTTCEFNNLRGEKIVVLPTISFAINAEAELMSSRKIARTEKEATNMQEKYIGLPSGWIQWKGTDVCMDVHCICGSHAHIDAEFAYNFQCRECGRLFQMNPNIEMIEIIEKDGVTCVVREKTHDE